MTISQTDQHKFTALDGIRGLLALAVAYGHFPGAIYFPGAPKLNSGLCVDFFFLLSGFVIAYTTRQGLPTGKSVLSFITRRIGRLWPLHVTLLGVLVLCKLESTLVIWLSNSDKVIPFQQESYEPYKILTNLFMLQAFDPNGGSWNFPSWSIGAEFWVYILLALLVWKAPKWVTITGIGLVFTSSALQWILTGVSEAAFLGGTLRCIAGFFIGYIVYRCFRNIKFSKTTGTLLETLGAAIVIGAIGFMANSPWTILVPALFALPLWVFACQRGLISDVLRSKPLQTLGRHSYGIYLIHLPVIEIFHHWWKIAQKATMKAYGSECAIGYANRHIASPVDCGLADIAVLLVVLAVYFWTVIKLAQLAYRYMESPARAKFSLWANSTILSVSRD